MSRQIQIRRGTAAEHDNFTGAIGEVTMDTTNKTLRVHDGVTVGGNKLMLADGFKSNITNCITEIPENIKLELNSGTLKLKAGSKIWIPNGKDAAQSNANLGSNYWTYIFYTGTEFIAIAKDGYFSWSQDGINWTQAVLNETITAKQWRGIAYGLGMYVAVGTNGYISTSTDGHTWTAGAKKYGMGSNAWKAVACDGTKFVAIAQYGHISTSTNGTTWSTAVEDANLGYNNWATIFYDGTKFIALSNTGYVSTSTDGTTWVAATAVSNLGNRWWRCMAFNGSKYVAIADQGWISTSVDGTTWTAAVQNADLGYGNGWIAITWDGTKFVAIGERGAIASSPDGESWGEVLYSQITIQNDITVDTQSATGKTMLLYNHINGSARADVLESACISGTTPLANNMLYNTFTNVIDYYNGSLVAEGNKYSFPLAMISVSNGSVTSIDNIFNGFGYFGSTVFALPGIKYLLPNGRKDNGGLNSTESAVQTILINSLSGTNDELPIVVDENSISADSDFKYNEATNTTNNNKILAGYVDTESGKIKSFYAKPVFRSADYSDFVSLKSFGITTDSCNKAKSGYYKLSNGLIIQWMYITNAVQDGVYTLPTAFTSGTSYIAIPSYGAQNDATYPIQIWGYSATTVTLHRYGGLSNIDVSLIAVGY